jgi:hypothetical protein
LVRHIAVFPFYCTVTSVWILTNPARPEKLQGAQSASDIPPFSRLFNWNKNSLRVEYEYQLTTEPLRVDLLIIKKSRDLVIDKNIARIFRSDNILEYVRHEVAQLAD